MKQGTVTDDRDVSLMAIDQYMRWVKHIPNLTDEEEAWLVGRVEQGKQERDKPFPDGAVLQAARDACNRLFEGFQRLVVYLANRVKARCRSLELLDLVQEGNLALLAVLEDMQTGKVRCGRLGGLVGLRVRCAMWAAVCDFDRAIRLPREVHTALMRLRQAQSRLQEEAGRELSLAELAQQTEMTARAVYELQEAGRREDVASLHALLEEATEEGVGGDCLFVELYQAAEAEETERRRQLEAAVESALEAALTVGQKEVVRLRYGFGEGSGPMRPYSLVGELAGMRKHAAEVAGKRAEGRLYPVLASLVQAGVAVGVRGSQAVLSA